MCMIWYANSLSGRSDVMRGSSWRIAPAAAFLGLAKAVYAVRTSGGDLPPDLAEMSSTIRFVCSARRFLA